MSHLTGHQPVRVRFAPSPTGLPHVGSLRTALFNYLYARHTGGAFLLRIEDTDPDRSRPEYQDAMMRMLSWAGITWDEPMVVQSDRRALYRDYAERLVREGKAYRCTCTPAELETRVMQVGHDGVLYGRYDGHCRNTQVDPAQSHAIRLAVPEQVETVTVQDAVKGDLSFHKDSFDDFIIIRSDGWPMYNFAVVVDDHDMGITHVIRGEEHLVNTPKQLLVYQALGVVPPVFAHVPLILGPDGKKLSKRDAASDASGYMTQGYLPMALMNYLARLGWAHGNDELFFSVSELASAFSLAGIQHKSALFDWKKLNWVNQQHLLRMAPDDLVHYMKTWMDLDVSRYLTQWTPEQMRAAFSLYISRVHTVHELWEAVQRLYHGPTSYEIPVIDHSIVPAFGHLEDRLSGASVLTAQEVQGYLKELSVPLAQVGPYIRVALTGSRTAPGIGDLVSLLGGPVSAQRLKTYRRMLQETMGES